MSRAEPDDLPADYGVDEQAESLALLDPPPPVAEPVYYGLRIFETEYETLVCQGHPPKRRMLAACNRLARTEWHGRNVFDDPAVTLDHALSEVRYRWACLQPQSPDSQLEENWAWCNEDDPGAEPFTELDWR